MTANCFIFYVLCHDVLLPLTMSIVYLFVSVLLLYQSVISGLLPVFSQPLPTVDDSSPLLFEERNQSRCPKQVGFCAVGSQDEAI